MDKRKSYRIAAIGRRLAELRFGKREIAAEILDESAEGFGILVAGTVGCHVGQTVTLKTEAGAMQARIANIRLVEPGQEGEEGESPEGIRTRIGLLRISDVQIKRRKKVSAGLLRLAKRPLIPLYSSVPAAVAAVLATFGLAAVLVFTLERPIIHLLGRELPPVREAMGAPEPRRPAKGMSSAYPFFPEPGLPQPRVPVPQRSVAESPMLEPLILLSRPDVLLQPEIVRKLGLSQKQQEELRQLSQLSQPPAGAPVREHELRQRTLEVLSPQQLRTWRQLAPHISSEDLGGVTVTN